MTTMSDDEKKAILKQFNRELDGFHAVLCMGIRCVVAAHNDAPKLAELLKQVGDIELSNGEKLDAESMMTVGRLLSDAYENMSGALKLIKPEDVSRFDDLLVRGNGNA